MTNGRFVATVNLAFAIDLPDEWSVEEQRRWLGHIVKEAITLRGLAATTRAQLEGAAFVINKAQSVEVTAMVESVVEDIAHPDDYRERPGRRRPSWRPAG